MPGIGGIDPSLKQDQTQQFQNNDEKTIGAEGTDSKAPVSVFHSLDQNKDKKIVSSEAQSSIFSQMNNTASQEVVNVKEGSFSFKTLFQKATEKFKEIDYESTDEGVKTVDTNITQQVQQFNLDATNLYNKYLQQRDLEATGELSSDKTKVEYKDAQNQVYKTEDVKIETKDGTTKYIDNNGKTLYSEDETGTASYNRNANGQILSANSTNKDGTSSHIENKYNDKGQMVSSSSEGSDGGKIETTYQYNAQGQRTSQTYTANGQTFTTTYTYNPNGTKASEVVTDGDNNVVETTKFDKNGNEVSYETKITDQQTQTNTTISQTSDKHGNLKTHSYTATSADGKQSSNTTETFRKNGNLKTQTTSYTNTNSDATNKSYNTSSTYRRGGEMKTHTESVTGNDGSTSQTQTKYRGSGITRKWEKTSFTNGDGTTTSLKTNFNMDNEISGGTSRIKNSSGSTVSKNSVMTFDGSKNKVPNGYSAVRGLENRYSNSNGEVFYFVKSDNGQPKAVRDHSSTARLHESRLKRELKSAQA